MTITFDLIPQTRVPSVLAEFSAIKASQGLTLQTYKALAIGQRISTQVRATGTLILGGQPTDGDKFVISDGVTAVTFEYDSNASVVETPTLQAIVIGIDLPATLTATLNKINAATFNVTAISITGGNTVNLRNDSAGTAGNVAITEPTNVSTFLSDTGMTGGDYTPAGTGTSLVPYRIGSPQVAANLWGAGSHLHRQAIAFFANNNFTELWGIAIDDTLGATKAAGTVTITGPATAAGTFAVYVGGTRYEIAVAAADTATAVGANLATAITADTSAPFTAVSVTGTVTITAKNAGLVGNSIDLRHSHNAGESLPAGLTVAIAIFSGGGGGVDLSSVFAAIGEEWFNVMISPYTGNANMQAFAVELESRWGPLRAVEALGFVSAIGGTTLAINAASVVNSGHMVLIPAQGSPTWTVEIAAAAAAVVAFNGAIDPARPFNGLKLTGVVAPQVRDRWTQSERDTALHAGVSTTRVDEAGALVLERVITTYRTNSVGAADGAFLDATTPLTLSYLRFDLVTFIRSRYPRAKVADDEVRISAGQQIVTPAIMKGEIVARAGLWESIGLVEDLEDFKASLICERNPIDRTRLDIQLSPNLINPLIVVAARITFII